MKGYEGLEAGRRLIPGLPVYARIDGRSFSGFTRGMDRPYCPHMSQLMIDTTRALVEKTHALVGYTQSDEISLAWYAASPKTQPPWGGKLQKMTSVLAGLATAAFTGALLQSPHAARAAKLPHFDCRVFNLPNTEELANCFLWREQDATKNAVSMAARSMFSHKQLQGLRSAEMQELMHGGGVNFNDYPRHFKRGTFVRRVLTEREFAPEELEAIPAAHRPPPGTVVRRAAVEALRVPRFGSVRNRAEFLLAGADPVTEATA